MGKVIHHIEESDSLSRLLKHLEPNQEVEIHRAGRPVARLTAVEGGLRVRAPAEGPGKVWIADDFADLLAEDFTSSEDGP